MQSPGITQLHVCGRLPALRASSRKLGRPFVTCPAEQKSMGRSERLLTTVAAIVHPELEVTEASDFCGSSGE
jgi:hypothetical protein